MNGCRTTETGRKNAQNGRSGLSSVENTELTRFFLQFSAALYAEKKISF
jgi:hypothetical protein